MLRESDVLKLVCTRLEEADIPYMLTGSFAANFYAVPRMTRDIDVILEVQLSDVNKLYNTFRHDFYLSKDDIIQSVEHESMFNIIHNESVIKIDFIVRKKAAYREIEFQRRRRMPFHDTHIWIVSPEDLIISKLFWAKDSLSNTQIQDVRNILSSTQNLDRGYIQEWVGKLELQSIYKMANCHE